MTAKGGSGRLPRGWRVVEGAHSGGLARRGKKIRPQFVPRYAGNAFDLNYALCRNARRALLEPSRQIGFVNAQLFGQGGLVEAVACEDVREGLGLHASACCTTFNPRQAPFRLIVLTTGDAGCATTILMADITRIHASKQPRRPHHIPQWAEHYNMSQADLAKELGADKSVVSRWYSGTTPGVEWQDKLAALFYLDDREALFQHPDEDWMRRFFRDKSQEQRDRAKAMLEAAFGKIRA